MRGPAFAKMMSASNSWAWGFVNDEKIASVKLDGITLVIESWGTDVPPRAGRPPSVTELIKEALTEKPEKRVIPNAIHRGRPRKIASAE
jgi:hypothetical protein